MVAGPKDEVEYLLVKCWCVEVKKNTNLNESLRLSQNQTPI